MNAPERPENIPTVSLDVAPVRRLRPRFILFGALALVAVISERAIAPRHGLKLEVYAGARAADAGDGGSDGSRLLGERIETAPVARTFEEFAGKTPGRALPREFGARYTGKLRITYPGTYFFWIDAAGGRGEIKIGGQVAADNNPETPRNAIGNLDLPIGLHDIEIEFARSRDSPVRAKLSVSWAKEAPIAEPIPRGRLFVPGTGQARFVAAAIFRCALLALFIAWAFEAARDRMPRQRVRRFAFALVAMAVASVVVLAALEAVVRVAGIQPREYIPTNVWAKYKFEPGRTVLYMGWLPFQVKEFEVPVTLNPHGWNDHVHALEKPDGVYRIAFIGDSFVEAKEVTLEAGFPRLLERSLNESLGVAAGEANVVEIIALGRGGTGTVVHSETLKEAAFLYEPDLVVASVFPGNDIRDNSEALTKDFEQWRDRIYRDVIIRSKVNFIHKFTIIHASRLNRIVVDRLVDLYLANLHLFREGLDKEDLNSPGINVYRSDTEDKKWTDAWETTFFELARMRTRCAERGVKFKVMIVKSGRLAGTRHDVVNKKSGEAGKVGIKGGAGFDADRPVRRIVEFLRDENIEHIILGPEFSDYPDEPARSFFWRFDAHWNELGHAAVAGELQKFLGPGVLAAVEGGHGDAPRSVHEPAD